MKGFIHLIEVAVAAVLITIVIGTFFSVQDIKMNWDHSDLLALGNSIGFSTEAAGNLSVLFDRFQRSLEINKTKPDNIGYTLYLEGVPEEFINVGCPQNCIDARNYLSARASQGSSYLNGRWVTFNVTQMSMADDFSSYDALILIGFTGYSTYESKLTDFVKQGKVIMAINDTSGTDAAFFRIFGLTTAASTPINNLNFTKYSPADDKTAKYFLGMGFDIPVTGDTSKYGYWYIWGDERTVIATSTTVRIENISEPSEISVSEGGTFSIRNSSSESYYAFRLKKNMFNDNFVIIQPLNASMKFENFCEGNVAVTTAKSIVSESRPAMTANGTAIWMSGFPNSDEYKLLAKAAIASRVNKWYSGSYAAGKNRASSSYYATLCCDMPEPAEINFILWYVY